MSPQVALLVKVLFKSEEQIHFIQWPEKRCPTAHGQTPAAGYELGGGVCMWGRQMTKEKLFQFIERENRSTRCLKETAILGASRSSVTDCHPRG